MTFAKINNFSTCFSLPDNCNYSKNANVHAAVVALKVFKSVDLRMYINMKNKVGDKELMGIETHLMCFVGGHRLRRGAASINSLEF